MSVTLRGGARATGEAIAALEMALGFPVNAQFKKFVSEHNGAEPDENCFSYGEDGISGVRMFIPVEDIPSERARVRKIPSRAYPIGYDDCGNFILIDEGEGGAVWFYDHEDPGDPFQIIAKNLGEFLQMLAPDE